MVLQAKLKLIFALIIFVTPPTKNWAHEKKGIVKAGFELGTSSHMATVRTTMAAAFHKTRPYLNL